MHAGVSLGRRPCSAAVGPERIGQLSSEIAQVGSCEAVAAAERDADLERLQREAVEGRLIAADEEVHALKERLKATQREADTASMSEKRHAAEERRGLQVITLLFAIMSWIICCKS